MSAKKRTKQKKKTLSGFKLLCKAVRELEKEIPSKENSSKNASKKKNIFDFDEYNANLLKYLKYLKKLKLHPNQSLLAKHRKKTDPPYKILYISEKCWGIPLKRLGSGGEGEVFSIAFLEEKEDGTLALSSPSKDNAIKFFNSQIDLSQEEITEELQSQDKLDKQFNGSTKQVNPLHGKIITLSQTPKKCTHALISPNRGKSLTDHFSTLSKLEDEEHRLSLPQAMQISDDLDKTINEIHTKGASGKESNDQQSSNQQGRPHGDIKPENLLIGYSKTLQKYKLSVIDFSPEGNTQYSNGLSLLGNDNNPEQLKKADIDAVLATKLGVVANVFWRSGTDKQWNLRYDRAAYLRHALHYHDKIQTYKTLYADHMKINIDIETTPSDENSSDSLSTSTPQTMNDEYLKNCQIFSKHDTEIVRRLPKKPKPNTIYFCPGNKKRNRNEWQFVRLTENGKKRQGFIKGLTKEMRNRLESHLPLPGKNKNSKTNQPPEISKSFSRWLLLTIQLRLSSSTQQGELKNRLNMLLSTMKEHKAPKLKKQVKALLKKSNKANPEQFTSDTLDEIATQIFALAKQNRISMTLDVQKGFDAYVSRLEKMGLTPPESTESNKGPSDTIKNESAEHLLKKISTLSDHLKSAGQVAQDRLSALPTPNMNENTGTDSDSNHTHKTSPKLKPHTLSVALDQIDHDLSKLRVARTFDFSKEKRLALRKTKNYLNSLKTSMNGKAMSKGITTYDILHKIKKTTANLYTTVKLLGSTIGFVVDSLLGTQSVMKEKETRGDASRRWKTSRNKCFSDWKALHNTSLFSKYKKVVPKVKVEQKLEQSRQNLSNSV